MNVIVSTQILFEIHVNNHTLITTALWITQTINLCVNIIIIIIIIDNSIDDWLLRSISLNYMTVLNFNFGLTIYFWLFMLSLLVPVAVLWDYI